MGNLVSCLFSIMSLNIGFIRGRGKGLTGALGNWASSICVASSVAFRRSLTRIIRVS